MNHFLKTLAAKSLALFAVLAIASCSLQNTPSSDLGTSASEKSVTAGTSKTISYYSTQWSNVYLHYQKDNATWTSVPGVAMNKNGSWFTATVEDTGSIRFCFNNGSNQWDSRNGQDYTTSLSQVWIKNQQILETYPDGFAAKLTFKSDNGKALANLAVKLQAVAGSTAVYNGVTDVNGVVNFIGMDYSNYNLTAVLPKDTYGNPYYTYNGVDTVTDMFETSSMYIVDRVYSVKFGGIAEGYNDVINPKWPYTSSPLIDMPVTLYKDGVVFLETVLGNYSHGASWNQIKNLPVGSYRLVLDHAESISSYYYHGEKSFIITEAAPKADCGIRATEDANVSTFVRFDYWTAFYGAPLAGMKVNVYKNGIFWKEDTIGTGGYPYGYQPELYYTKLGIGEYRIDLDQNADGKNYKGSITLSVTDKEQKVITPTPVMHVEETVLSTGKTIRYFNASWSAANIHYIKDNGTWTTSPGVAMTKGTDGWFTIQVADENSITFCFNNGAGTWDSKGGSNYTTSLDSVWVKNSTIYASLPTNKVTFKVSIPKGLYKDGIYVQVRGNKGPLSWTTGFDLTTITFGYDKDTFEGSIDVDGSFEYKYVLFDKPVNKATWESISGNRQGAGGNTYTDTASF